MKLSQFFTARPADDTRDQLLLPVHDELDLERLQSKVQPILTTAAQQIATSGKVYRWIRYDKSERLCLWNEEDKMFQFLLLADFIEWIAKHYQIFDSNGQQWLGPSKPVADRLYAAVLRQPALPVASWKLQDEIRANKMS